MAITNKQIFDAQKVLSMLKGTPIKMLENGGKTFWQVTYDNETYIALLTSLSALAETPIYEPPEADYPVGYHRTKI